MLSNNKLSAKLHSYRQAWISCVHANIYLHELVYTHHVRMCFITLNPKENFEIFF